MKFGRNVPQVNTHR